MPKLCPRRAPHAICAYTAATRIPLCKDWMCFVAQTPTRAVKALRQVGTVRGNLAFLSQSDLARRTAILTRFAVQYRITPSAMTRARTLHEATADDCAAAVVANIDKLTGDASFIRGINLTDSSILNPHLHALAADCRSFMLEQGVSTPTASEIDAALARFLDRGLGSGTFAGSALGPVVPLSV